MNRPILLLAATLLAGQGPALSGQVANGAVRVGDNAVVFVPRHASLEPTSAFTLECWIRASGAISHGRIVRKSADSGNGYHLSFAYQTPNLSGDVFQNGVLHIASDQANHSTYLGSWHHVAVAVTAGGQVSLYIDGALESRVPAPATISHSSDLSIGGTLLRAAATEEFIGLIDEVRFWNIERTAAEIQRDHTRWIGSAPGLVSSWSFDGDLRDSVGPNHGIAAGASLVPSDSPVGRVFSASLSSASWQGGEWIDLTGSFPIGIAPLAVRFGSNLATQFQRIGNDLIQVRVPPGRAGSSVPISVEFATMTFFDPEPFGYLPRLTAPVTAPLGSRLVLRLETPPPGFAVLFAGVPPAIALPLPPFDGELAILPPVIELLSGAWPFQSAELELFVPNDPAWTGQEILFQAFFARVPIENSGTFTLPQVVRIL
ncbi:MAG: hypothetical protein IPN34_15190 [Planctomycetes bacterium]|nr:hypothetical protein [Planctomycetota bacterium]